MAGTPWFKFYDEFLDDPKMLSLSDGMVTLWVRMLCLANRSDERGRYTSVPVVRACTGIIYNGRAAIRGFGAIHKPTIQHDRSERR